MTTLFKNVQIVDGSGSQPFKGDVLVRDDKVLAVGSFPNAKADTVILGNEGYLVPGFVDVDAGSDRYLTLFSSPLHKDFLLQGITSILVGHCGFSLAPTFYGNLEQFFNWSKVNHININWKSVAELLHVIEGRFGLGVNMGTLVGHKMIREEILKNPREFRRLTVNELRVFRSVVERALNEGAFGLSSGLGYSPYDETTYHEMRALLEVVGSRGGIYTTHLRNEREGLVASVEETVRISQETHTPTIISHFRPFGGFEEEYKEALGVIEGKIAKADVYFDINPFSASAVSLDTLLPAAIKKEDRANIAARMRDKTLAKEIADSFPKLDPAKMIILQAPEMEFLNGKTLYEFAQTRELSAKAALLKLMEITQLRGVVLYENLDTQLVTEALFSPRALISTNSPSFDDVGGAFKPDRAVRTFTEFLHAADRRGIPVEKAIAKITSIPAALLKLEGRGLIASGYFADVVLLTQDKAVSAVMVNGRLMVEQGAIHPQAQGAGKVLHNTRSSKK